MTPPHLLNVKHNYFCIYHTNAVAFIQKWHFFSLFFPGPPRADVASIQEKLHLGQNLKLTCPIQGDPTPLFEWFKVSHTHHGSLFYLLLWILTENWPIFHFKILQSSIWYSGLLGWWDRSLIDQGSDVPSTYYFFHISWKILWKNHLNSSFIFLYLYKNKNTDFWVL